MALHLRAARVNAGFTQKEVIEEFNNMYGTKLAVTTLVRWEQEKTFPSAQQFKALCKMYGVKMDDIFVPDMQTLR